MDNSFRIRMCAEDMAPGFQFAAKLLLVVNLTVVDDPDRAILIGNGLFATLQVDDAQTAVAESNHAADIGTFIIRPAMRDGSEHPLDLFVLNAFQVVLAANTTHAIYPIIKISFMMSMTYRLNLA
jgi:hypothetical protein